MQHFNFLQHFSEMLQTFQEKKIVAKVNVANFLGKLPMLQKPIVAKKKSYPTTTHYHHADNMRHTDAFSDVTAEHLKEIARI